jgi:hypothetical protein
MLLALRLVGEEVFTLVDRRRWAAFTRGALSIFDLSGRYIMDRPLITVPDVEGPRNLMHSTIPTGRESLPWNSGFDHARGQAEYREATYRRATEFDISPKHSNKRQFEEQVLFGVLLKVHKWTKLREQEGSGEPPPWRREGKRESDREHFFGLAIGALDNFYSTPRTYPLRDGGFVSVDEPHNHWIASEVTFFHTVAELHLIVDGVIVAGGVTVVAFVQSVDDFLHDDADDRVGTL